MLSGKLHDCREFTIKSSSLGALCPHNGGSDMRQGIKAAIVCAAALMIHSNAAAKDAPVELAKCTSNLGTIAVVEGDTQGWLKYNLGSPRELLAAMAIESGCFTPHNAGSGAPATYLMNVIAGDAEEVDKGMEMAKSAAFEGLVRSGAASQVLGRVPFAGAMLGAFGGLGGKKKTVAAGIRVISPANGMTLVSGSGTVKKSTLTFAGMGGGWNQGAVNSGYSGSKDGQMLAEAFMMAFNAVAAQQSTLAAIPAAAAPVAAAVSATVAVDTKMLSTPAAGAASLRALRAGTALTPTGKREGLFVEVSDSFGTKGWVSVENLK